MFRRVALAAVIALVIAPLAAPASAQASAGRQAPADWRVRIDRSQDAEDPDDRPDIRFMTMGAGIHVTGGPAGVFWRPGQTASGAYVLKANFTLLRPSGHTNYYGLVFGGSDLEGASQSYVYFLVAQDGTYLVKHRSGANVSDVRDSTPHAAIRRPDASGRSVNALEVRVSADTISYVVNGTVVHTTPKSGSTARTDGLVGARINHLLDVQVDGFDVQRS